jgi:hypothetical protein
MFFQVQTRSAPMRKHAETRLVTWLLVTMKIAPAMTSAALTLIRKSVWKNPHHQSQNDLVNKSARVVTDIYKKFCEQ